jgi:arylformamidase
MVFIHGGYWQGSDKSQFSYLAQGFIPAGITFAAVNYSLAPEVGMDEIVHQGRKALTWVWQHAEEFGYNSDRIFVSGHSAGGHLASLLASTDWPNFDSGLPPDLIKGICAISGIYDLEPIRRCYLNAVLEMDEETSKRNSPINHLPELEIPMILSVGGLETEAFQRQSEEYAARLQSKRFPLEVVAMPGFHHYSVVDELANPASPLNQAVISLINPP